MKHVYNRIMAVLIDSINRIDIQMEKLSTTVHATLS